MKKRIKLEEENERMAHLEQERLKIEEQAKQLEELRKLKKRRRLNEKTRN